MSAQKKCPHCGHINLEHAVYCFQCGKYLVEEGTAADSAEVARRSRRILQAMWDADISDEDPELPSTAALKNLHLQEPITCLSCGALNRPNARYCTACGAPLMIPDREAHLIARASARTDVGRVRENNEDSIGLWALQGVVLALVADGMGGAVAGEEASRLTVESVQADFVGADRSGYELLTVAEEVITEKLTAALQTANLAMIDRVDENLALRGMGTTATLAYVRGRRAIIAHVGDSRAYLVDGEQGWISQITSDHSFVEALLAAGHITPEEAAHHPMKNVLYRALGQTPDTMADIYDRYLKGGDRIILCSDGLTRHVTPEEIASTALEEDDPDVATQRLIAMANERGGEDNISIIVILMEEANDATRELAALDETLQPGETSTSDLPDPVPGEPSDSEVTLAKAPPRRDSLLYHGGVNDDSTIMARQTQEWGLFDNEGEGALDETQESLTSAGLFQAFRLDAADGEDRPAPLSDSRKKK